jgi:hypothetical protein
MKPHATALAVWAAFGYMEPKPLTAINWAVYVKSGGTRQYIGKPWI